MLALTSDLGAAYTLHDSGVQVARRVRSLVLFSRVSYVLLCSALQLSVGDVRGIEGMRGVFLVPQSESICQLSTFKPGFLDYR